MPMEVHMPVPFQTVPVRQLLMHEAAYQMINISGKLRYADWDIAEFEKGLIGCDGRHYLTSKDDEYELLKPLSALDHIMPFRRFGEAGQHYAYELFLSEPNGWHTRGGPFFWTYTARRFTYDKLPMTEQNFTRKYMSIVEEFGIPYGTKEAVYIERFAAGGISSGVVTGEFVAEAHQLLLKRLKKYT